MSVISFLNTYDERTSVTFYGNGGTIHGEEKETAPTDDVSELPTPDAREGYRFMGWQDESERLVTDPATLNDGHNHTLKAQWEIEITFDANGGTVNGHPKESVTLTDMQTREFPTAVWAGYRFLGWFTDAAAGEQAVLENVRAAKAPMTLYAHWDFDITFDANGGTVNGKAKDTLSAKELEALPSAERGTRQFLGWFTMPDGGDSVSLESLIEGNKAATVYAHWKSGTVTLDPDGKGTVGGDPTPKEYPTDDVPDTLPDVDPNNPNDYEFEGWVEPSVDPDKIVDPETLKDGEDHTLVPKMGPIITFDANGGTVNGKPSEKVPLKDLTKLLEAENGLRAMLGWFTQPEDGDTVTAEGLKAANKPAIVYAHWKTGTVTIDPTDKGTIEGDPAPKEYTTDDVPDELPTPTPNEPDKYEFVGWEENGKLVDPEDLKDGEDHTVTAKWTEKHVHNPVPDPDKNKDATCTQPGWEGATKCEGCGKPMDPGHQTDPLGHITVDDHSKDKDATCTEQGWEGATKCERCGVDLDDGHATDPLGHDFGEWEDLEEEDKHEHTCKRDGCGYSEKEEHHYGDPVVVEPTEDKEGSRTYTCEDCGHQKVEKIPAKGHTPAPTPDQNQNQSQNQGQQNPPQNDTPADTTPAPEQNTEQAQAPAPTPAPRPCRRRRHRRFGT